MSNLLSAIRSLKVKVQSSELNKVIDLVNRYIDDTKYYIDKGDCETALVTASYAEGLLDALKYLNIVEVKWERKRRPKVVVGGTFEILHPGHLEFLKFASQFGDLYVIVSRDENAERFKGRKVVIPQDQRLEIVRSIKYVKDAIIGESNILEGVKKLSPDIVVLGPDQNGEIESKLKEMGIKVIRMEKRICKDNFICSTSDIIKKILEIFCSQNSS